LSCVDEDVVLLKALNIALNLVHLLSEAVHAVLLANGVKRHDVVGLFLELFVQGLPLLLECADQLLSFSVRHQELLLVALILLLNLHFTNQIVLVLDLIANLG